jgi:hypothetical protein
LFSSFGVVLPLYCCSSTLLLALESSKAGKQEKSGEQQQRWRTTVRWRTKIKLENEGKAGEE